MGAGLALTYASGRAYYPYDAVWNREPAMRLPNAIHESRPWRIQEIAPDFTLEDVCARPELVTDPAELKRPLGVA